MKKLLCSILALSILASGAVVCAAEPSEEEMSDLYNYEIMVGYEDGELRLDKNATRAEAVKMMCHAGMGSFGIDADDEENGKYFSDIPQNHWAVKYINSAVGIGILDSTEDGTFNPDGDITYNEFVKMLVRLLGYEPMAELKGGYPAGYMATATQIGLTKYLNFKPDDNATRGDAAIMTAYALDVPLMMQTAFGAQIEYNIMDGSNGTKLFTLRTLLDEYRANIKQ